MGFSDSVIIFHPGSRHLYFGRSSDPKPQSVLHIIARRRSSQNDNQDNSLLNRHPLSHRDILAPLSERRLGEKVPHEVESARLQLALTLQSSISSLMASTSSGSEGPEVPHKKIKILADTDSIVAFNKLSKPLVSVSTGTSSSIRNERKCDSEKVTGQTFIVGEDVLKIKQEDPYNIHCPWKRGQMNLHREVGGTITSVIQDMEDIWRWCVVEKLGIPQKEMKNHKAIVIVPVMFDRVHAKELMTLIINRLGFQSCFFLQDHVCASFGAGISCCTVVDVGDQKISVSCVEDGVSYPYSRLELKYGGGDLTVALWHHLCLNSFPIPLDITDLNDWEFLNKLKESRCHLNLKSWITRGGGSFEDTLLWSKSGVKTTKYRVKFGDELIIVPLSYFNPDLLRGSIGRKAVISYGPQPTIPDDPHDQNFLADIAIKRVRKESGEDGGDEEPTSTETTGGFTNKNTNTFNLPLGIDQAIIQSINMCNVPEDLKRNLYSVILVVGGGFKTTGLLQWLLDKLKLATPKCFHPEVNSDLSSSSSTHSPNPKIISCSADAKNIPSCPILPGRDDPCVTTWQGAAILSSLDTAKELWITKAEWDNHGSKILREKSLFHY